MNQQIFDRIESYETAASLGIASSLDTFMRAAKRLPAVSELRAAISAEGPAEVEVRLSELVANDQDDGRHRSNLDYAATVYMRELAGRSRVASDLAKRIASDKSGRWFWANQLARRLIAAPTSSAVKVYGPQPAPPKITATNKFYVVAFSNRTTPRAVRPLLIPSA